MESQAIARAHRMGQTDTVQVHRLLTEDSVDERIRDILKDKRQLFDEFARDSFIAKRAPDRLTYLRSSLHDVWWQRSGKDYLLWQGEISNDSCPGSEPLNLSVRKRS
jgi:hypothetical protein